MDLTYRLMKAKIERSDLSNPEVVEQLQEMLDIFYAGGRLTTEEYQELVAMLHN